MSVQDHPLHAFFQFAFVFVLGAGVFVTVSAMSPADEPAVEVGMTNTMEYTPDTVRIQVGETVHWKNSADVMHTVTADPDEAFQDNSVKLPDGASTFNSGNLDPGETFEYTFDKPGTYRYFCIPHEAAGMKGTVIVSNAE